MIAGLLLIASLLLVANTIRLSIYARRREVEVMRLGRRDQLVHPLAVHDRGRDRRLMGAGIAVGLLLLGKVTIVDPLADDFALVDNLSTTGFVPPGRDARCRRGARLRSRQRHHLAPLPARVRPSRPGARSAPVVVTGLVIGLVLAAADRRAHRRGSRATTSDARSPRRQETIEANYFEAVEPSELEDASIAGMVREMRERYEDRFSHYFTAEQLEDFEAATSGRSPASASASARSPSGLRVATVFPDTPAEGGRDRRRAT